MEGCSKFGDWVCRCGGYYTNFRRNSFSIKPHLTDWLSGLRWHCYFT